MKQLDKSLFVFLHCQIQLRPLSREYLGISSEACQAFSLSSLQLYQDVHLPQLYLQLQIQITLVVDPLYCKNLASQKSVVLLYLIKIASQLPSQLASQLSLIFLHPSKDSNLFFHSYPLFQLQKIATQLLTYHQPRGKVLHW